MAFIQDPRLRQRWNQISQNAETYTENAAAGIWTFQRRYIAPCLQSVGDCVDSCASPCLGDREERARRARGRDHGARRSHRARAEHTFDFYDDWEEDYSAVAATDDDHSNQPLLEEGSSTDAKKKSWGIFGGWGVGGGRAQDWDRLLVGSGAERHGRPARMAGLDSEVTDQPRRKGMSYGTRAGDARRRSSANSADDLTIIPSTAPLGFLARLPFRIGGTLRYKPSAANLREHPGAGSTAARPSRQRHGPGEGGEEHEPLLGPGGGGRDGSRRPTAHRQQRSRSSTIRSEITSTGSSRSRRDLFHSDEEGDEDAVPLDDDEFAVALDRMGAASLADDRSSNRTRSSKGKRPAADRDRDRGGTGGVSRTVSRTTLSSMQEPTSIRGFSTGGGGGEQDGVVEQSIFTVPVWKEDEQAAATAETAVAAAEADSEATETAKIRSLEDLRREEQQAEQEEADEIERRRRAASQLARERGLVGRHGGEYEHDDDSTSMHGALPEPKPDLLAAPAIDEIVDTGATADLPAQGASGGVISPVAAAAAAAAAAARMPSEDPAEKYGLRAQEAQPSPDGGFIPARLPHFR